MEILHDRQSRCQGSAAANSLKRRRLGPCTRASQVPIIDRVKWIVIAFAVMTSACASTGAVPKPFPTRGAPAPAPPASIEPERAAGPVDMYALVGTALSFRGTPYRNGGSDPSGFDCSGFTQYVYAQYGIPIGRDVREQFRHGQPIETRDLAPGDLVFFDTSEGGVSHVAIAVGGNQFVHAPSSTGVVRVERLSATYWSRRYVGARRVN